MRRRAGIWASVGYAVAFVYATAMFGVLLLANKQDGKGLVETAYTLIQGSEAVSTMQQAIVVAAVAALLSLGHLALDPRSHIKSLSLLCVGVVAAAGSWLIAQPFAIVLSLPLVNAYFSWREASRLSLLAPNPSLERP
jgi:hypothetical protein